MLYKPEDERFTWRPSAVEETGLAPPLGEAVDAIGTFPSYGAGTDLGMRSSMLPCKPNTTGLRCVFRADVKARERHAGKGNAKGRACKMQKGEHVTAISPPGKQWARAGGINEGQRPC